VKRSKRNGYKKTVRHKACASEFDYQGWKAWGVWRRDVQEQIEAAETLEAFLEFGDRDGDVKMADSPTISNGGLSKPAKIYGKDCWNDCDYPSECRWGKQYGVETPNTASSATVTMPTLVVSAPATPPATVGDEINSTSTTFDDILLDISDIADETLSKGDVVEAEQQTPANTPTSPIEDKKPSMDDMLDSAKRRKRRSTGAAPSPLSSNPPSPSPSTTSFDSASSSSTSPVLQRALDDFELDLRKSFGRAGEAVSSLFSGSKTTESLKGDLSMKWSRKRSVAGTW
jgi:hypothetical protein